jgi:hypothetical protein
METETGTMPKFDWLPFAGDLPGTAQARLPSKERQCANNGRIVGTPFANLDPPLYLGRVARNDLQHRSSCRRFSHSFRCFGDFSALITR